MEKTVGIEGTLENRYWFHFDDDNDVLYLRLSSERCTETLGDMTDDGVVLMRRATDDVVVGCTVIGWNERLRDDEMPLEKAVLQVAETWLAPSSGAFGVGDDGLKVGGGGDVDDRYVGA